MFKHRSKELRRGSPHQGVGVEGLSRLPVAGKQAGDPFRIGTPPTTFSTNPEIFDKFPGYPYALSITIFVIVMYQPEIQFRITLEIL